MPIGRTLPRRGIRPAPVGFVAAASGPAYDAASTAYFAAMTVQPDATRKGLLNDLIVGLKSDGVWASLDWLSVVAAHDAQAARINVKTPSQVATVNGTITFTANRGYAGDGATGYLDTGVMDNAGGNYSQNSASMSVWTNTAPLDGDVLMSLLAANTARVIPTGANNASTRINNGGAAPNMAVANGLGLTTGSRTDATTVSVYRNSSGVTATVASVALAGSTIVAGRGTTGLFSVARFAAFGFGGGLTGTQVTALYNRLNTYLTAVGGA